MRLPEIIQNSLDYIEENLKTELAAEELAKAAGYSTYHYYRLFSSVMGSSIASYIVKRRLDHALADFADGRKPIDIALDYGFDTYAGFYKAFRKMYGCPPKKYVKIYGQHKPFKPEVPVMFSTNELKEILKSWDNHENYSVKDVYSFKSGEVIADNVWSVGDDYVLKTGDRNLLLKNLAVSKALHKQGFDSSLPVLANSGDEFVDGSTIFVLTKRLQGNPLSQDKRNGENRLFFMNEYGQSIARLHKALSSVQKEMNPDEVNLYQNVADWALPNVLKQNQQWDMKIDDQFFEDYIQSFGKLYDHLPKQLIHRDPNPGNILFDGDKVSGFIDFDLEVDELTALSEGSREWCAAIVDEPPASIKEGGFIRRGYHASEMNVRLWDPCYCATGILSEGGEDMYTIWLDLLQAILHGYNTVIPLSSYEKRAIYYVVLSIATICAAYFESMDEYKGLAKTSRRMICFIVSNKDVIDHIF